LRTDKHTETDRQTDTSTDNKGRLKLAAREPTLLKLRKIDSL